MKSRLSRLPILLLACVGSMHVSAGDFDEIVSSLLGSDRGLELSRAQKEAEVSGLSATNVLPDPEAEFEFLGSGSGDKKYNLSVSQSFDWPGVYGARRKQLALEETALMIENESEINERCLEIRTMLIDIIAANLTIGQLQSAIDGGNELLKKLEADYKDGNVSVLELNKLRIELADFKLKLSEAIGTKENLMVRLLASAENGEELSARVDALVQFPLMELRGLDHYISEAKANAPSLQSARNTALVAKARRDVAKRSTLPGFSAGYRLSHEDGELFNGFTVGVSVPLWRATKERKSAEREEIAAMMGEKVEEINVEKMVEATYSTAHNLKSTIAEYGNALTASDNIGLLRKAYNSGAITLTELVLDVNYFIGAQTQYIELQRQYYNALAELGRYDCCGRE